MADKELAAKLAKRLACVQVENDDNEIISVPPPPVPIIPQKIVENPYVAVDNSVSIDDLIRKALEKKEENNNNVPPPLPTSPIPLVPPSSIYESRSSPTRLLSSPTVPPPPPPSIQSSSPVSCTSPIPPPCSASTSTAKGIPPKTTIRDLLQKEYENNSANVLPHSKCPSVSIEHHKRPETPTKRCSPEFDGSELELKLAAQRNKKISQLTSCDQNENTESIAASPAETTAISTVPLEHPSLPDFPPPPPLPSQSAQAISPVPPPKPSRTHTEETQSVPPEPQLLQSVADDAGCEEMPKKKDSFEELEEQVAREIAEQEAREQKELEDRIQSENRPLTPVKSPEVLRTKMGNIPSPLLIEMIKTECGSSRPSTPPPVPPPKPQSRPQSPVVRKPVVSSLGLLCDPLMSVETEKPMPSPPIKKVSPKVEENPDELNAMLERRTKILEGDVQPQFVNRKLSVYAEFSEFSRKQIKFFQETFTKFDEDCDGFIDFNELKRMMEKLGEAQTHISLKDIIKKVDEDDDGKISMREFFLLFRLAAQGQLGCSEVFTQLAESVDVSKEGVLAAASFFQAKIAEQTKLSKFEEEIKQEQEEKKREEEEKKKRREKFLQNKSIFH